MASGCLLIGRAPAELVRLLGFNPVVEADRDAPERQVREILADPAHWQPRVDRARERVREVGDWRARVRELRAALGC
nr:glycosyltransferase [Streptomyces coryli]